MYYLPRLRASNVYRLNERKWLYFGKGEKKTIPRTKYDGRGLRWWHGASGKYTYPLKLMDKFTYLGSRVSSTENDINTRSAMTWTAIDRSSVILNSELSNKIKSIFATNGWVTTTIWMHYMDADKVYAEKSWRQLQKNARSCTEQILENSTKQHLYGHRLPISKTIQIRRTKLVGCCWRNKDEISDIPRWTPFLEQASVGRPALIYL